MIETPSATTTPAPDTKNSTPRTLKIPDISGMIKGTKNFAKKSLTFGLVGLGLAAYPAYKYEEDKVERAQTYRDFGVSETAKCMANELQNEADPGFMGVKKGIKEVCDACRGSVRANLDKHVPWNFVKDNNPFLQPSKSEIQAGVSKGANLICADMGTPEKKR